MNKAICEKDMIIITKNSHSPICFQGTYICGTSMLNRAVGVKCLQKSPAPRVRIKVPSQVSPYSEKIKAVFQCLFLAGGTTA